MVIAVGVGLLLVVGGAGESAIEAWVGEELKAIVDDRLKPDLEFDTLDYQAPLTVVMTNVRLTADDPDTPGGRVDVIDAKRLKLELKELPRSERPVKLESVQLDGATLRLVDSAQGGLVGFSDFLEDKTPGEARPLSEVLQITQIDLRDSAIEYDARLKGAEPMRFDEIDTTLAIHHADGGTYGLDLAMQRVNGFSLSLVGNCDLDAMWLAVNQFEVDVALSRERDHYLPPQVQVFLKKHELTGDLSINATGVLNLTDVGDSTARLSGELLEAHGRVDQYRLPIRRLAFQTSMANRLVKIERIEGDMLGGEVQAKGAISLGANLPASMSFSGNGLQLDQLQVMASGDEGPSKAPVDGKVDLQLDVAAPLQQLMQKMAGQGELRLSDGRIARVPIISNLIEFMETSGDLDRLEGDAPGTDEAQLVFELRGDHAYISKADIDGSWFAMRGRGKLFFDQELAMNVNAGPLEKVQGALGQIGRVLGRVTDGLLAYRVTGRVGEMKIRPVPLGGIIGAPGDDE